MKTNVAIPRERLKTHEGGLAKHISPKEQLRRSVLACMLWEDTFYEDGASIAKRIEDTVPFVKPLDVYDLAVEARGKYKLRHAPLWVVRAMAKSDRHRIYVDRALYDVIQRADELTEFLALYWKDGKTPIAAQVKKGLARAFTKFDEYALAKYDRDGAIKLRDVLFLVHAKPIDDAQAELWKRLVEGKLQTPDTWEVALSSGADKRESWERLIKEKKLGGLALLRNLRNMKEAGVKQELIIQALDEMKTDRILPFRFIAAAKHAPQLESHIESAMLRCLDGREKLPGKTVVLVDVSGSMTAAVSGKSDLSRKEAAEGLAILANELCEESEIYSFSNYLARVPSRHGFSLSDAIEKSQQSSGTYLAGALDKLNEQYLIEGKSYDRIIVISDEQTHDNIGKPYGKGYVINVAPYRNGVGYGDWTHIDGWSEAVFDYIIEVEKPTPESKSHMSKLVDRAFGNSTDDIPF